MTYDGGTLHVPWNDGIVRIVLNDLIKLGTLRFVITRITPIDDDWFVDIHILEGLLEMEVNDTNDGIPRQAHYGPGTLRVAAEALAPILAGAPGRPDLFVVVPKPPPEKPLGRLRAILGR